MRSKRAHHGLTASILLLTALAPAPALGAGGELGSDFLGRQSPTCFLIGVAFERADENFYGDDLFGDQLIGVSGHYRGEHLGLGARLMMSPKFNVSSIVEVRGLFGVDLRLYWRFFDTEWSYGAGALVEVRLADHFWLTYVTPVEAGVTIIEKGSLHVRLFVGMRYLVGGQLVNAFLFDPNGLNNENAEDALRHEKDGPVEGFVRLVFSRRID